MRKISHSHPSYPVFNTKNNKHAKASPAPIESNGTPHQGIISSIFKTNAECSAVHDSMDVLHVASETSASFGIAGNLDGIGTAAGAAGLVSGLYFGITGAADLKRAIDNKDVIGGMEAGGHILAAGDAAVGTARLAVQSSAVANMIGPTAAAIIQSPVFKGLGTAFGVAHGAVESGVGIKEIYDGYKAHDKSHIITGLLDIASGASVAAIALGGGPVAGVALAATFAFQMLRVHILND